MYRGTVFAPSLILIWYNPLNQGVLGDLYDEISTGASFNSGNDIWIKLMRWKHRA